MAGIYIHVPFCCSRCIYCNFYSTTLGGEWFDSYVNALCMELVSRREELIGQEVQTIYFGGGTPSLLPVVGLQKIFRTLRSNFNISNQAEITIESNPDDITEDLAKEWGSLSINRVSLGVQTFNDKILKVLRRRHTAEKAKEAVEFLRSVGIHNLTLDLIYGLPGQTFEIWQSDVQQLLSLQVQHLSAYALSYEEGTVLKRMRDQGEISEADEESIRKMYLYLIEASSAAGFEHYEISNFALPGYSSRHNSSYWSGVPYLGVGPGAHSYDGKKCRRANSPQLRAYVQSPGVVSHELDILDEVQLFEEYLLTGMRTAKGVSLDVITERFGSKISQRTKKIADRYIAEGKIVVKENQLVLTLEGIFISDYIISDLMLAGDE